MEVGNSFAYLVLALWPVVAFVLFKRLSPERAVIWTILGGYLLLPPLSNYDFPLLPPLDKILIPNILAFAGAVLLLGHRVPLLPASWLARLLAAVFVFASIPTVLTNLDPIPFTIGGLPGLRMQDVISATGTQAILLIPLLLGRHYLATAAGHRDLLTAYLIAAVAYAFPALAEVRLSPQINIWVYGFFQHDFSQMWRWGAFRPIVFFPHAIWLAVFFMIALVSSAVLMREADGTLRRRYLAAFWFLALVLLLCKTLSALIYAAIALPLVFYTQPRVWVRVALAISMVALIYPLLRGVSLFPVDGVVGLVEHFAPPRAESLGFRLQNEELLLARADEKPLFGWGGWGRNHIHNMITGKVESITDGRWIIAFGVHGWFGFLAEFGLLTLPTLLLWQRMRREGGRVSPYVAGTSLILALNLFDLIPNATLEPITWLMAGAVLGHAERVVVGQPQALAVVRARPPRRTVL